MAVDAPPAAACLNCGKPLAFKTRPKMFCSETCGRRYHATPCEECGAPTSRKGYRRCAACIRAAGAAVETRNAKRDLVPNAPLRERLLWLEENDPDFSMYTVCVRIADRYPSFIRRRRNRDGSLAETGDSSRLKRLLGIYPQHGCHGRPTSQIDYEMAVAVASALDMWPVDAGL